MDVTLLISLIAFFCMAASWLMLPTGQAEVETTTAPATAKASLSEA